MTDFPQLKMKALVNFPAQVIGGPDVVITKNNGIYTIGLDFTGPWVAFTPAIGVQSGALTLASAVGRFLTMGKTVFVNLSITVTTNGTGAGFITASLPLLPRSSGVLPGRASAVSGKALSGFFSPGSVVSIFNYDNTYPAASGEVLTLNGVYEAA